MKKKYTLLTWFAAAFSVNMAVLGVVLPETSEAVPERLPVGKHFMSRSWDKVVFLQTCNGPWRLAAVD